MQRIAGEGYFVVAAGMRGRKGASGSEDASGKEIHDIYDAIQYVQTNFPALVSDKVTISGYSGGGGNALAAASKFPDTFNVVVDHLGMSDYGYDVWRRRLRSPR
jgi:predicted acyl esterase